MQQDIEEELGVLKQISEGKFPLEEMHEIEAEGALRMLMGVMRQGAR